MHTLDHILGPCTRQRGRGTHSCMTRYRWDVLSKMSSSVTMLGCLILREINGEKSSSGTISHISLMLTVNWSPDGILAAQLKSPSHLFPLRRGKHYSKLESNLCVCPVLLTDKLGKPLGVKRREAFDALTVSCCG